MALTGAGLLNAIEHWGRLTQRGLTVSITYGTTVHGLGWSVEIKSHPCFDHPLPGRDIAHCLEIAEREALRRGFIRLD